MLPATKQRLKVSHHVGEGLLSAAWIRRLKRISFLGTLDFHPRSRGTPSRFEHSLGVAELGARAARDLELSPDLGRTLVAACLLHDIGHYPLSHAAEPAFARALGADHHRVGEWLVRNNGPLSSDIHGHLLEIGVDPEAVWSIIDGSRGDALGLLLRAPINLDTLDGIRRVVRTFRLRRKTGLPPTLFTWIDGELGLTLEAVEVMDEFWRTKGYVYERVINLPSNILAEARLCQLVANTFTADVFERFLDFDDEMLATEFAELWPQVMPQRTDDEDYELANHAAWGQVLVRNRKVYLVQSSAEPGEHGLPASKWQQRYRHVREPAHLISRRRQLEFPGFEAMESPEI